MHCTGHCSLFNVYCIIYTVHYKLYTDTIHCMQYTIHCTLYTVHRTVYTVHCTLNTVGTLLNVKVSPVRDSTICHPPVPRSCTLVWDKRTTETAKLGLSFHEFSQNQQNEPRNVVREAPGASKLSRKLQFSLCTLLLDSIYQAGARMLGRGGNCVA